MICFKSSQETKVHLDKLEIEDYPVCFLMFYILKHINKCISYKILGLPGPTGGVGQRGARGAPGESGQAGKEGKEGPQGAPGHQGEQGLPGPVGSSGPEGPSGKQGPPGIAGRTGDKGPQGKILHKFYDCNFIFSCLQVNKETPEQQEILDYQALLAHWVQQDQLVCLFSVIKMSKNLKWCF